jgi:hypothetical protein
LTTPNDQLSTDALPSGDYPPAANLRAKLENYPLPVIVPGTVDPTTLTADKLAKQALDLLATFNSALDALRKTETPESRFFPGQIYRKDAPTLTWHLRTFTSPSVVAASLL